MKHSDLKHILCLTACRCILLLCFFLFDEVKVYAYDARIDGIYYDIYSSTGTAKVTYYKKNSDDTYTSYYSGTVVIPDYVFYNGVNYVVKDIDVNAFRGCSNLTSVIIGNSVTSIQGDSFSGCIRLKSVIIGNSVTSISRTAFRGCSGLNSMVVESRNRIYDSRQNCNAIINTSTNELVVGCKNTTIPSSVISIGQSAFSGCSGLTSVTIPNSVTSIGSGAFYGCSGLTSVTIPNSVTSIEYGTFYGCSGLTSVTIPNSVTSIGWNAFYGTAWFNNQPDGLVYAGKVAYEYKGTMLTGTHITLEEGTLGIADYAFRGCYGLASVTIPNSVTSIGESAFEGCSCLASVTIPNNLTRIESRTFNECSGITSISIGSNVTQIDYGAFSGCNSLKSVYSHAETPPELSYDVGFSNITKNNTLYVPRGSQNLYSSVTEWRRFNIVEVDYVESIEFKKLQYDILVGKSETPEITFTPVNATYYQDLCWQIKDSEIAMIENGIVTGLKTGTTTLIVTTTDGTNLSASCIINVINPVQSISLSKTQLEFEVGDSETITASCTPANADDVTISWTSSDNSIVTVTNGNILAVGVGEAEIIAKSVNGIEARCTVVVKPTLATSISLNKHSLHLTTGLSEQLVLCVLPERTTNKAVTWSSTNPQIASVDEAGVVTANSNGSVTIKASTTDGSNLSDECTVIVTTVAREITLDRENASLIVGQTLTLVPTVIPVETSNKAVLWQSSNSNCATISQEGKVSAIATGTAVIIATTTDGTNLSASCIINVINPVISLTLDRTCAELLVEQQITLNASCSPANADNQKVSWTTSNGEIATVSQDGIVTAMGEGDVAIIATTTDGTKLSASCQVHVKRHKQSIIWNQEALTCQEGGEMIVLEAGSSSGLPVTFSSSDPDVLSIFDLGDVVYANPVKQGKAFVSVYQQGNYKYEPAEQAKREIEVIGKPMDGSRTLVAYYSQSALMDGIVAELTNQIAGFGNSVYKQKIEPSNARINDANHDAYVRDSVMNVIALSPDDAKTYPEIKQLSVAVNDYDDVILVYPIWNVAMAAPMQTFCFQNREILASKSVAYIEYDLFDEAGISSDAKVLRLCPSNIADKKDLIKEWLDNSVATGILQFRHDKKESRDGIYDLQGRKISNPGKKGLYIIKGHKMLINDNGGTNR